MSILDGANSIDFCIVNQDEFSMVYVIDLDGSMNPRPTEKAQGPSTLVATDDGRLLKLVDTTKCQVVGEGCYSYCANTCFRSIRYNVIGPGQTNYLLKVCLKGDKSRCTTFPGGRRGDGGSSTFIAHLPTGNSYDAVFLDVNGKEITPDSAIDSEEESFCPVGSIFDITLVSGGLTTEEIPPPTGLRKFLAQFKILSWFLSLLGL
jgi:hypothetical protein